MGHPAKITLVCWLEAPTWPVNVGVTTIANRIIVYFLSHLAPHQPWPVGVHFFGNSLPSGPLGVAFQVCHIPPTAEPFVE